MTLEFKNRNVLNHKVFFLNENKLTAKRSSKQDFPTPESPISSSLNK